MQVLSVTAVDRSTEKGHLFYIGFDDVQEILEHRPAGEGDKWYYDVIYHDGKLLRLFDFSSVGYIE